MVTDIFDFWSRISRDAKIHPADEEVFDRLGLGGHGFRLKTLPGCFMGRLRSARVILLFMSPGESPEDEISAESTSWQDWHVLQRQGNEPLPDVETPAGRWWRKRTGWMQVDQSVIRSNVAFLNIGAYKSKEMKDPELLAALPSSRVCLDWVHGELFPAAEKGERIVICLRAAKFWGLKRGKPQKGTLFSPNVNRAGDMLQKEIGDRHIRDQIVMTTRAALGAAV